MFLRFRWVADFRDPWTAPLREPKSRLSIWIQRRMERSVMNACDRVIANTPGNRAALLAAFPQIDPAKIEVITNGFDPIDDSEPDSRPDGPPESDMVYFGELYPGMFDLYFGAIQEIRERRPELMPKLELYGFVHDEDVKRVERAGLDGYVLFRGTVTYGRSIELMRRARSLLLLLPPQERWATCVPSKLYAYLFAGRPVLVIAPPGDATRIVSETGVGVSLTSRDPATIADGLADFVQAVRGGSFTASCSGESLRPYTMESIASKVEQTLLGANG
jgi:glycosyltransferase involved in cell wall biosynthesis